MYKNAKTVLFYYKLMAILTSYGHAPVVSIFSRFIVGY